MTKRKEGKRYYMGMEVEVLPPGRCGGSTDWWIEDLCKAWWVYYCVGEGDPSRRKSKGYLRIFDKESTKV